MNNIKVVKNGMYDIEYRCACSALEISSEGSYNTFSDFLIF